MFWFTGATLALLGTFAQVNPVWLVGPSQPGSISADRCRLVWAS
jgi:ubiquinol-cytochrome c reductase cytochrome b subunit